MGKKNLVKIMKKDGSLESFSEDKILRAVSLSAERALVTLSIKEQSYLLDLIKDMIKRKNTDVVPVSEMHVIVENALRTVSIPVYESYCQYRNHKREFKKFMEDCYAEANAIQYGVAEKENANADTTLVSTKRCNILNTFNKALYNSSFLTKDELSACKDGYIYVHDTSARRDTMNCCLFNLQAVLEGGFYSSANGGIWYNQPKSLDTFGDVAGDVILMAASQQYGGLTVCEIDKIMVPYAELTYEKVYKKTCDLLSKVGVNEDVVKREADRVALEHVEEAMRACFQGWEYKFNSVASSRGDYPFITFTYGLAGLQSRFGRMAAIICSETRKNGQGRKGVKKPVLFPKLVFLYDENLHGEGKELEDVFEAAISCCEKSMYPDFLSLTGDGTEGSVSDIYKRYGVVISPMGCRAFLSPWFERGGMEPMDEDDKPVYVGRFNIGAVSLNLPMIYQKSVIEGVEFFEVLDFYLEMIRKIHIRTYDYLGHMKASCNPLSFMEGGFLGGYLKADERIAPLLKSATASFGITALNELQMLYNGKRLSEDQEFANETMDYIIKRVGEFKKADGNLYALYGTPAESLCGTQVKQFRKKYGIVEGVSDRPYVSNSFHCHVSEDILPTEKQDIEYRLFHKILGGRIQYVKYPIDYNRKAMKSLVRRAMTKGFYEGINMAKCTCEECGYQELEMEVCPRCGASNISRIDRMNGYLQWTQTANQDTENSRKAITSENMEEILNSVNTSAIYDTRTSAHKIAEIKDRKSM